MSVRGMRTTLRPYPSIGQTRIDSQPKEWYEAPTERPIRGLGKETAVKGRIALLASCMTAAAAVAAPVAFASGSGGGNSSSAPGQAQAIANCNANIDKQVAAGIGPGGGKKEGHTGPTNCDGFFGRP